MAKRKFQAAASGSLIIAPAVGEFPEGGQVSFLFSLSQVEDITGAVDMSSVPFSPAFIDGVSGWRGHALPVLSLEILLGLAQKGISYSGQRAIVVRKRGGPMNLRTGNGHSFELLRGAALHRRYRKRNRFTGQTTCRRKLCRR